MPSVTYNERDLPGRISPSGEIKPPQPVSRVLLCAYEQKTTVLYVFSTNSYLSLNDKLSEGWMMDHIISPQDCAICSTIWEQETGWLHLAFYYRLRQSVLYFNHSKKWASQQFGILLSLQATKRHTWREAWTLALVHESEQFCRLMLETHVNPFLWKLIICSYAVVLWKLRKMRLSKECVAVYWLHTWCFCMRATAPRRQIGTDLLSVLIELDSSIL